MPTPCIGVCELEDRTGLCRGCQRTLTEIATWGQMDPDHRRAVLDELPRRRGGRQTPPDDGC
ncbi:DUF1289 domain-containing protein [bacterium]|nr:DUF1289 domain-containing protein [bacterium]